MHGQVGYDITKSWHGDFFVPFGAVKVIGRIRSDSEYEIDELRELIAAHGLIHPIVVDSNNRLIAGGRRYRAVQELEWPDMPVTNIGELTDEESQVVEIVENLGRKDLHFVDVSKGLFKLRDVLGSSVGGRGKKSEGSIRNLAKLAGRSESSISQFIRIGGLAQDPEVEQLFRGAKSMQLAIKVATEILFNAIEIEQASRVTKDMPGVVSAEAAERHKDDRAGADKVDKKQRAITHKQLVNSFLIGDCIDRMAELDDNIACFAEVDPPYGVELDKATKGGVSEGYTEIPDKDYPHFLRDTAKQLYRVMMPDTFGVWWFAPYRLPMLCDTLIESGFKVDQSPCVWAKAGVPGQVMQPNISFARAWECFVLFRKGSPRLASHGRGRSNVFSFQRHTSKEGYTAQRPLDLIKEIIRCCVAPRKGRNLIISPFLGSGTTILAAHECGFKCIGWDLIGTHKKAFSMRIMDMFGLMGG